MDPFITLIVLTVLVISGVWGSIILADLFRKRTLKLNTPPDDLRIDQLREGHDQLEARLERLEEEVSFFRELQRPEIPERLPGPASGDFEPES
jgi:hypothetical protein